MPSSVTHVRRPAKDMELDLLLTAGLGTTNDILPEISRVRVHRVLSNAQSRLHNLEAELLALVGQFISLKCLLRNQHPFKDPGPESHNADPSLIRVVNEMVIVNEDYAHLLGRCQRLYPAVAPHKYLPLEILTEIFVLCVESTTGPIIQIPGPRDAPLTTSWTLGHVCSRWRQVAAAESRLWNSILFFGNGRKRRMSMLAEAFNRCGQSKIHLNVVDSGQRRSFIQDAILPRSHQITKLSLTLLAANSARFFLLKPGLFDSVEELDLSVDSITGKVTVFAGARNLRRFSIRAAKLDGPPPSEFPLMLNLPWLQLTHLDFWIPVSLNNAHHVLRLCPRLCDYFLVLGKSSSKSTDPPVTSQAGYTPPPDILLPQLRKLSVQTISHCESALSCDFLLPLQLPAIEQFDFILPANQPSPPAELGTIIERLGRPRLRAELRYAGVLDIATIGGSLDFFTSIQAYNSLLSVPTMQSIGEGRCFPKLASVTANIKTMAHLENFYEMLKSRWSRTTSGPGEPLSATIYVHGVEVSQASSLYLQKIQALQAQLGIAKAKVEIIPAMIGNWTIEDDLLHV